MKDIKIIEIDSDNIYKSFYDNFGVSRDALHKYIFDNLNIMGKSQECINIFGWLISCFWLKVTLRVI